MSQDALELIPIVLQQIVHKSKSFLHAMFTYICLGHDLGTVQAPEYYGLQGRDAP